MKANITLRFTDIFESFKEAPSLANKAKEEAIVRFETELKEKGGTIHDWKLLEILKKEGK